MGSVHILHYHVEGGKGIPHTANSIDGALGGMGRGNHQHFTENYAIIVPLQYLKCLNTSLTLLQWSYSYKQLIFKLHYCKYQCQCPCQYFCSALPVLFSHKAKGWKYTDIHYLKLESQNYSQQLVSQTTLNSINPI